MENERNAHNFFSAYCFNKAWEFMESPIAHLKRMKKWFF